ncbi:hypothetical protein Naga_103055g1 [Nannochloropsis gaditana]|uniref:Uncharacterized protein n=1 Tax=Nannochloropsis gaditana TaxID=72520 RepID=W7THM0_9STRA|nr:hypothetical protein Naga_103055g1 [Nannochloropsis gaditana]
MCAGIPRGGLGGLYQQRKVDTPEPAHAGGGARRGPTLCHAGPYHTALSRPYSSRTLWGSSRSFRHN